MFARLTTTAQLVFFARGRDFEAASDAHSYTIQERAVLASFESLEYLPPNNVAYRDYLSNQTQQSPSLWSRWLAMGMIGFSVGAVSFTLKSTIDRLCEFRRSLLFDAECRGDQLRPGSTSAVPWSTATVLRMRDLAPPSPLCFPSPRASPLRSLARPRALSSSFSLQLPRPASLR